MNNIVIPKVYKNRIFEGVDKSFLSFIYPSYISPAVPRGNLLIFFLFLLLLLFWKALVGSQVLTVYGYAVVAPDQIKPQQLRKCRPEQRIVLTSR